MKLTVLIVDADPGNAVPLAQALQSSQQIGAILTAFSPDEALMHAKAADLVLLDPVMPGADGAALLRRMLEQGLQPGIIALSSFYSPELLRELDSLGTAYCMYKPVDIDSLTRRIVAWHNGSGTRLGHKRLALDQRISNLLLELGMTPISGFYDCRMALKWLSIHPDSRGRITKELYPYIAHCTHRTPRQVERHIRYAIEQTWLVGDPRVLERYFGYSVGLEHSRPSNGAFLRTLAECIRGIAPTPPTGEAMRHG